MIPVIVPTYAAILVLIFVFLSARVIQMRASAKIGIGTGNNPEMERRIRVHGNFAEYVPLALLLLVFMEMQQHSRYLIHILCIALIVARVVHAIGVTPVNENFPMRVASALTTFAVLAIAAIALLINGLRAGFI
jgi:uncharacterized membrane protein YecN with MAPEG domain